MKKLDWFVADRQLSTDVAEFMRCHVWRTELNLRYADTITACRQAIEGDERLVGSLHEDEAMSHKRLMLAEIQRLEDERDKEIERQTHFELTPNMKILQKSLRKNPADAEAAIIVFFKSYHLDITDTGLVDEILMAAGEKIDNKTLVNTRGMSVTAMNTTNCFKMVFAKAYEHMAWTGTIKPVQIPPLMMDKYDAVARKNRAESKKRNKKTKKAAA